MTRKSLAERFELKVDRSGGPEACHLWVGRAKLTVADVRRIRMTSESARSIARDLGVHKSVVLDARHYRTWKEIGL